ncbi:hypothetical protein RB195_011501 [Necator americanus]|uniref:ET module n=1 Tax=Necator americanus TaxID=51031 RepID=A0ABR1D2S1_NECAM
MSNISQEVYQIVRSLHSRSQDIRKRSYTMTTLLSTVLFAILLTSVYPLKCYEGETNGIEKPTQKKDCTPLRSRFCVKARAEINGVAAAVYGCATDQQCLTNGCTSISTNKIKCCCDKDFCNLSSTFSITLIILAVAMQLIHF